MPRTRKELEARLAAIRSELLEYERKPEAELTDEDTQYVDSLTEEYDEVKVELDPILARFAKLAAVRSTAVDSTNNESSTVATVTDTRLTDNGGSARRGVDFGGALDGYGGVSNTDPFKNIDAIRAGRLVLPRTELRGRALDAIERANKRGDLQHDWAENATALCDRDRMGGVARHVLVTGSDEYREAFDEYLANPEGNAQRTALSLTQANGGYLLPFVLDPTIVLTNAASANPFRRISNVKTTTSNTWNGVTSAGVTAAWLAEGVAAADASPTVGNIVITPLKAAAWIFGSFEVLADTDFGAQLPGLLQDAKDRLEEAAFSVGTGTLQPKGVVTAATTTVATVTTGAYVVADVYALHAALPPRFRNSPNAAFVANVSQINRTRQLDTAGGASFWTNLGKDSPEQLLGKGIYESSSMASVLTTTTKIMVFGDFSQYYIVDRVGVSVLYEPMVTGTGASANVPTGQSGWFMFWRVNADAAVPGAFRALLT
jgi:HK97 family phage major capsid protein